MTITYSETETARRRLDMSASWTSCCAIYGRVHSTKHDTHHPSPFNAGSVEIANVAPPTVVNQRSTTRTTGSTPLPLSAVAK